MSAVAGFGSSHASFPLSAQLNCYPLILRNTHRRANLSQATQTSKAAVLANSFSRPIARIPSSLTRRLHRLVLKAFFTRLNAEVKYSSAPFAFCLGTAFSTCWLVAMFAFEKLWSVPPPNSWELCSFARAWFTLKTATTGTKSDCNERRKWFVQFNLRVWKAQLLMKWFSRNVSTPFFPINWWKLA